MARRFPVGLSYCPGVDLDRSYEEAVAALSSTASATSSSSSSSSSSVSKGGVRSANDYESSRLPRQAASSSGAGGFGVGSSGRLQSKPPVIILSDAERAASAKAILRAAHIKLTSFDVHGRGEPYNQINEINETRRLFPNFMSR